MNYTISFARDSLWSLNGGFIINYFYMNDTYVLAMLVGFAMIGGSIFSTAFVFWAWRHAPKWLCITAGIMNALCLLSLWGYSTM